MWKGRWIEVEGKKAVVVSAAYSACGAPSGHSANGVDLRISHISRCGSRSASLTSPDPAHSPGAHRVHRRGQFLTAGSERICCASRRTATSATTPNGSAQLDNDIAQLGDGLMAESLHIECEYLLLTARKA
jgi:hypothetical protein